MDSNKGFHLDRCYYSPHEDSNAITPYSPTVFRHANKTPAVGCALMVDSNRLAMFKDTVGQSCCCKGINHDVYNCI